MENTKKTYLTHDTLRDTFQAIDEALWESIENPPNGLEQRRESLESAAEHITAYIDSRVSAFETLIADRRFWDYPVSQPQKICYQKKQNPASDSDEDSLNDSKKNTFISFSAVGFFAFCFLAGIVSFLSFRIITNLL